MEKKKEYSSYIYIYFYLFIYLFIILKLLIKLFITLLVRPHVEPRSNQKIGNQSLFGSFTVPVFKTMVLVK